MTTLSALPIAAAALSLPLAWRTPAHRPLAVALVAAQALEAARPALPPELAWGALLALPALSAWAVRVTLLAPVPLTGPSGHGIRIDGIEAAGGSEEARGTGSHVQMRAGGEGERLPRAQALLSGLACVGAWTVGWWLAVLAPWSGWWPLALAAAVAAQGAAWWRWRRDRRTPVRFCSWCDADGVRTVATHGDRNVGFYCGPCAPVSAEEMLPRPPPSASEQAALVLAAGDAGGLLVGLAAGWAAVGWWAAAVAAVLVGVQARAIWAGRR